jgi:hypothetical protein
MKTSMKRIVQAALAAACLASAAPGMAAGRNTEVKDNPRAENSAAQHQAAEEYLRALVSGDARAVASTILEQELDQLRKRLLDEMKLEADRDDSLVRERLFGPGMPLSEIERLTAQNFFAALATRLHFGSREFERVDWLEAVNDSGGMVQMVGRLVPNKDKGEVRVPVVVSIVPWGKDWKAALPLDLQAQIDDLRTGRVNPPGMAPVSVSASTLPAPAAPGAPPAANSVSTPQEILELFTAAEKNLKAKNCEAYYDKQMSPNFRLTTGKKALLALVKSCENREELREQLLTAIRLARERPPRFQYAGTRVVYDLSGLGLPYPTLVVEQVNERWYIAE